MRSSWITQVGPKSDDKYPYKRQKRIGEACEGEAVPGLSSYKPRILAATGS